MQVSYRKLIRSLMKARQKRSVIATTETRIFNPYKTHLMNTTAYLTLYFYVNS